MAQQNTARESGSTGLTATENVDLNRGSSEDLAFSPTHVPGASSPSDVERKSSDASRKTSGSSGSSNGLALDRFMTAAADKFHLHSIRATGPGRIFNPTTVRAHIRWAGDDNADQTGEGVGTSTRPHTQRSDLNLLWRSRDNRKGRNSIVVPSTPTASPQPSNLSVTKSSLREIAKNVRTMFTTFPYWDIAFWSGWSYTVGSALFVIDGAFSFSIVAFPGTEFKGEETYGVPLCFFFGAIFYQIGAVMAYLEAVNDGSFHGSAMRRLLEGHEEDQKKMLDEKIHGFFTHLIPHPSHRDEEADLATQEQRVDPKAGWRTKHRKERPGSIYPTGKAPVPRRAGIDLGAIEEGEVSTYTSWRWWPSWHMLRTHHIREIGWVACTIQLFGVTLYGMTSIVILPGILDSLNQWQTLAAYWIPQMVAAACFLIASLMFTLETQETWWKPDFKSLGWWIGFWSTVGSVGFELCAGFGPTSGTHTWAAYQSDLSSMWGSAAYLIGSLLQWYEAINKNPVAEIFNEPGPMKSYMVRV